MGPTIDSSGVVGVQGGLGVGFGYATSERGGVEIGVGAVTGSETQLGISSTIEGVRLGEEEGELGYRAGLHAVTAAIGKRSFLGAGGAVLYPLRRRFSSDNPEKGPFSSTTRTEWALGLEAEVGAVIIDEDGPPGKSELRLGAGTALALEWWLFSSVHCLCCHR
ncbi:MAG TPA: hypothetical protein VL172_23155, partial [Kofleriaceae bacterium]|nr:hypothetical protein [Kofleriaceae bacterium]